MPKLQVLAYPSKILREKTEQVTFPLTDEQKLFIESLTETMYAAKGVGLGANQVGRREAIFVLATRVDGNNKSTVFINPTITDLSVEKERIEEGCLSLPGVSAKVERYKEVTVRAQDINGDWFDCAGDSLDYMARALQHEIDHLEGRLFIDYLSPTVRELTLKKFAKLSKRYKEFQRRLGSAVAKVQEMASNAAVPAAVASKETDMVLPLADK